MDVTTFDRSFTPAIDRPSLNTGSAAVALVTIVLYHAAFGFTASWRTFIVDRRGAGIRAQMVMLALTCLVFFPALGSGHAFIRPS